MRANKRTNVQDGSVAADGETVRTLAYRAAVHAFGEVAGVLSETSDRDAILRLVGRHICELTGIERCSVYLRDEESGLYRGQAGWSPAWERGDEPHSQERIKRLVAGTDADALAGQVGVQQDPAVVPDPGPRPHPHHVAPLLGRGGLQLARPVRLADLVIVVLFLD